MASSVQRRINAILVAFIIGVLVVITWTSSHAADLTWDGGSNANSNWSTKQNWGNVDSPAAGDSLFFGGTTQLSNTNDTTANTLYNGLTFNSGAGAFILSGNAITLGVATTGSSNGNSLTNLSSNVQTINLNLALQQNSIFNTGSLGGITIGGVISGGFGVTKNGTSILTFSGGSANTYSGTTTVNAGELDLNKTAGVNAIAGNLVIGDGSGGAGADIVKLLAANQIANSSDVTIASSGVLNLNNNAETIDGLSATSSTASVTLGSGTLTVGANSDNAANFAGAISGTGGFTKTGTGTQTLSGTNTYSGDTQILAGDLRFDSGGTANSSAIRLGNTSGSTYAVLSLGFVSGNDVASALEVRSGSSGTKVLRSLNSSGTNTYSGNITLNTGLTLEASTGGTLLLQGGSLNLQGNTLTIDSQVVNAGIGPNGADAEAVQGTVRINEVISGTGGSITKDGSGTLILQGTSNTFTGGTTIRGGTVGIYADGSLGAAPGTATNNIFFAASNASNQTATHILQATSGNVTLAATRNINIASGITGTFDSNGNTFTVNGVINGSGGNVEKIGNGSLVLTGNNTYTGTTAVTAGTLLVNGNQSAATGAVSVTGSGTILGGSGVIGGTVSVASGNTLAPGATGNGSTETLGTGSLSLADNSNFSLDLNGPTAGSGYDQLSVAGSVSINGSNLVLNSISGLSIGNTLFILLNDNSGLLGASDAVVGLFDWQGNPLLQGGSFSQGSYTFTINYAANGDGGGVGLAGNDIALTVNAIPEPSTWIGAVLALASVGFMQRRRLRGLIRQQVS